MSTKAKKILAITMARNEGAYLLEWVCWHRMMGFYPIVLTNDCTDHSQELLDCLADAGWLKHIRHFPKAETAPKASGYNKLRECPDLLACEWALLCDVDEFFIPDATENIRDFLAQFPQDTCGITLPWRIFGNGGWNRYQTGEVTLQFRRCAPDGHVSSRWFKSLIRHPAQYDRLDDHAPRAPQSGWDSPDMIWRDASGARLDAFNDPSNHPMRMTHDVVQAPKARINHYIIRSLEHFAAKRGTLCASAKNDRYNDDFLRLYNINGSRNLDAYRFEDALETELETAFEIPGVAQLHTQCCLDYVASLVTAAGNIPEDDGRYKDLQELLENISDMSPR